MSKRVLLLVAMATTVDDVRQRLQIADVELLGGTGLDDVRSAFADGDIDHVIIGAGLSLETRLAMIREVFQSSDRATVHLKDRLSGREGYLPFVQAVLVGLKDYEPQSSPQAMPRTHRPDPGPIPSADG